MQVADYQELAKRTAPNETQGETLLHASLGLAGEVGEIIDTIKRYFFYGTPLDVENITEELGDIAWYLAHMANGAGVSLETVLRLNIEKLEKRYPEKFTQAYAMRRLDKDQA